jgi:hypothetical protein
VPLSFHEECHTSLLVLLLLTQTCKEMLDGLYELMPTIHCLKTRDLMWVYFGNLAITRQLKTIFEQKKELIGDALRLISSDDTEIKLKTICSNFLYNLVYKCTKTISALNKKAVLEEIRLMINENESQIDRLNFDDALQINSEKKESSVDYMKTLVSNLRGINGMIAININN